MREADRESVGSAAGGAPPPRNPSLLKRAARKVAQLVYRVALPIVRPLAFRTRRYLAQSIQDELQRIRAELTHEIRQAHAIGIDVLQKTALSVQHEVLVNAHHWHNLATREAQTLSAGLHQGIQASRESIREELLRSHDAATRAMDDAREALRLATEAFASNTFSRLDRIEQLSNASARRVSMHSDQGTVLLKSEVGYVLCSDSDHAVLAGLLDTGELERGTRLLIQQLLRRGDVFVDVGAHLGLLSLAAARAMHGEGKIFAFEPFPRTREMLEKSLWINGFTHMVKVHGAAVSNQIGETTLFLGATSGHHSIFALDVPSGYTARQVDVPLVTLDSALPSGQSVTLLKIDAEGAEINIIEGARFLLSNNPDVAMIVELGPAHLERVGHPLNGWLAAFAELGFVYRAINADTGMLENVSLEQLAATDSTNLFFARPGSSAWEKMGINV